MNIRSVTMADKQQILDFTKSTFEFGDYIADVFDDWLKEGLFLAAEIEEGTVVGIMHVSFLEDGSAWFEGGRVHPEYRRQGIATALSTAAAEKIRPSIIRTLIEESNIASKNLVKKFQGTRIMSYGVYEGSYMGEKSKIGKMRVKDIKMVVDNAGRLGHDWVYSPWKSWQKLNEPALISAVDKTYFTQNGLAVIDDFGDHLTVALQFFDEDALDDFLKKAGELAQELHKKKMIEVHIPKEQASLLENRGFKPLTDLVVYEMNNEMNK